MEIKQENVKVETSDDFVEHKFSIGDEGMIFHILRDKMYTDPISAIVRELSCNARDANREVGKNIPIEIHLPNSLEKWFSVKDNGPGISPDRMSDVFVKYASSTKRNDNNQTGGWGLGAKTPFSYSDNFDIITIFDGIKYTYSAFIDETRCGKIALLSQEPTDECSGTLMRLEVKKQDFNAFIAAAENQLHYFNPRPKINASINLFSHKKIIDDPDFFIFKVPRDSYYTSFEEKNLILIDDINYKYDSGIKLSFVPKDRYNYNNDSIFSDRSLYIAYKFGNGELSVSSNRESIYNDTDKVTADRASKKYNICIDKIKSIIKTQISSANTISEARNIGMYFCTLFNQNFVTPLAIWNDKQVDLSQFDFGHHTVVSKSNDKINIATSYYGSKDTNIVVNDTSIEISRSNAKKILEKFSWDRFVIINKSVIDRYKDYLDNNTIKYASSIALKEPKKKIINYTTYFIDSSSYNRVAYKEFVDCKSDFIGYFTMTTKDNNNKSLKFNNKYISDYLINSITKYYSDYKFFAFNIMKDNLDLEEVAEGALSIEDIVVDSINNCPYSISTLTGLRDNRNNLNIPDNMKILSTSLGDDHEITKYLIEYNEFNKTFDKYNNLLNLVEQLDLTGLSTINDTVDKSNEMLNPFISKLDVMLNRYPLLKLVRPARYDDGKEYNKEMINYIKLIDDSKK